MSYQFILLYDHDSPHESSSSEQQRIERTLRSNDLRCQWKSPTAKLYVSDQTPTLVLPGGHIVIGHLFNRCTELLTTNSELACFNSDEALRKYVRDQCWGEYLLITQVTDPPYYTRIERDPSGGIACVYSLLGSRGFVTSDISLAASLGMIERRVDWQQIAAALTHPRLKTEHTGLLRVRELLPGCALSIGRDAAATKCLWSPWPHVASGERYRNPAEAVDALRDCVRRVTHAWASVDGSLLLELSGGLDSSIVGACLHDSGARLACGTLLANVPGTDERHYARLIADMLGVDLLCDTLTLEKGRLDFEVPASSHVPAIGLLQFASDSVKEEAARRLSVNAHYSGGGGDSVFCYLKTAAPAADAFLERGLICGLVAVGHLADLHQCTVWKAARLTARKLLRPQQPFLAEDHSFLSKGLDVSSAQDHPWFPPPKDMLPGDEERVLDLAGTQMFRDSVPRGRNRWFRMPLLSQPVVETCLRIPSWMWIDNGQNRAVARAAFAEILPGEILHRRSKGTFINYWGAAYHRNRKQMRDFLLNGLLQAQGIVDADSIRSTLDNDTTPRNASLMRLFQLCMVENWVRQQH